MTKAFIANLSGTEWPPAALESESKIIQRIPADELSHGVKASRMGSTESDWVARSQQGEAAAFEELVRQHQHMVHALTYRMTGSTADAEDLAQEVFLRTSRSAVFAAPRGFPLGFTALPLMPA